MDKQRMKFTFPSKLITDPVIYELAKKFNVVTNIRRADVGESHGWVVLEMSGDEKEIEDALQWVKSVGVRVDPVGGDVVEG